MEQFLNNFIKTGTVDTLFYMVVFLCITDIALGFARGWAQRKFCSTKARQGIVSHLGIISVWVAAGYFTAHIPDITEAKHLVNIFGFYLAISYGVSILQNLEALGAPIPKWLIDRLVSKRDDIDKK